MNKNNLPEKYQNPCQVWKVFTENDSSYWLLGVFEGHVDEIAFALASQSVYGLRFEPVDLYAYQRMPQNTISTVDISFGIDSDTWSISSAERAEIFRSLLENRRVNVGRGDLYASVKLIRKESEEQEQRRLHKAALEKARLRLSPEEFQALGLDRTK